MFHHNIKQLTRENTNFRKVIQTGEKGQLVLMSIPVGGEIGMETHPENDQLLFFVEGTGEAIVNDEAQTVNEDEMVYIPAGTFHNFVNRGQVALKLYTVYAPPNHPDGIVEKTKEEAEKKEPEPELPTQL